MHNHGTVFFRLGHNSRKNVWQSAMHFNIMVFFFDAVGSVFFEAVVILTPGCLR